MEIEPTNIPVPRKWERHPLPRGHGWMCEDSFVSLSQSDNCLQIFAWHNYLTTLMADNVRVAIDRNIQSCRPEWREPWKPSLKVRVSYNIGLEYTIPANENLHLQLTHIHPAENNLSLLSNTASQSTNSTRNEYRYHTTFVLVPFPWPRERCKTLASKNFGEMKTLDNKSLIRHFSV